MTLSSWNCTLIACFQKSGYAPPHFLHSLQALHRKSPCSVGLLILKAYLRGGTLQVVNVVTPMLLNEYSLKGSSCSTFSRLQHLTLMIEPRKCSRNKPSELNASMANLGVHSQLESLYIGFVSGFDCSDYDRIQSDQEDSIILRLSSMQHLKSVHLDSFWPALPELPTGASLHATFKSAPGQKHPGLWAGRPADVQNPRLSLRSSCQGPSSVLSMQSLPRSSGP